MYTISAGRIFDQNQACVCALGESGSGEKRPIWSDLGSIGFHALISSNDAFCHFACETSSGLSTLVLRAPPLPALERVETLFVTFIVHSHMERQHASNDFVAVNLRYNYKTPLLFGGVLRLNVTNTQHFP